MNILELQEEKSHKIKSAEDIVNLAKKEDRILTEAERKTVDDLIAQAKTLDAKIAEIKESEKREKQVQDALASIRTPEPRAVPPESPNPKPANVSISIPEGGLKRYAKLQAFRGPRAEERAYISGQWYRASFLNNAYAQRWCRENGVEFRNALSEGTNTAGGYLVPDEMTQAIIDLREEYGVFRRNARVLPMGRDVMLIPRRTGGVTAAFVGENSAISESDPTWDSVQLTAKKLGVLTRMSTEVAEDAVINMADWLAQEFAYAFALKEDQCGFIGDGTSTYGGIVGVAKKFENNTSLAGAVGAATTSHDTFGEIDATDLATAMAKLPAYARMGAKWYCSQVGMDLMFGRLMAAAGGNTIQTVEGGYRQSYLGHEIVVSQVLNAGASTDYTNLHMALFGRLDLSSTIGERRGVEVRRSDDRYFDTDQIALKATSRIDIVNHDVGDTSNAGPIVCLLGGSA